MRFPVIPLAALILGAVLFLIIPFRGPRSNGTSPVVSPAMTEYAIRRWTGSSEAALKHGRELLQERCEDCHHRPGPEMAQSAQWPDVLKTMALRAKLNDHEREAILQYVLAAKATTH